MRYSFESRIKRGKSRLFRAMMKEGKFLLLYLGKSLTHHWFIRLDACDDGFESFVFLSLSQMRIHIRDKSVDFFILKEHFRLFKARNNIHFSHH